MNFSYGSKYSSKGEDPENTSLERAVQISFNDKDFILAVNSITDAIIGNRSLKKDDDNTEEETGFEEYATHE